MRLRTTLLAVALLMGLRTRIMAQSDSLNWREIASMIARRMALVRGERVLLVGIPGTADPLVPILRDAVRAAGGVDLGAVADHARTPGAWATDFTRQLDSSEEAARERLLRTVDVAVMMPGPTALGFNPLLAIPSQEPRWIPYYGYGAGVVRLSLGDNTELGGSVRGDYVRWNFFTDATLTIGSDIWVRAGKLVK